MNKLKHGVKYTGKQLIKMIGLRTFQDLTANGRLEWVSDNSFGHKLYIYKI